MRLMIRFAALVVALALAPAASAQEPSHCSAVSFEGTEHTVCRFDLRSVDLRLFWQNSEGQPFGTLGAFSAAPESQDALFAMNAGMYQRDRSPAGLYIENGSELQEANTADGYGNFHLKPNGVLYIDGDRAGVVETDAFLASGLSPDFATQSGPMLVIDGALHPRFIPDSDSLKIRNGVCAREDGREVIFAISSGRVNFHDFARLFRDALACDNALYLDGTISSLYAPEIGRRDLLRPVGPIVAGFPRDP